MILDCGASFSLRTKQDAVRPCSALSAYLSESSLQTLDKTNMPEVYAAPPDFAFPRNFKGYGEKGLEGLKWPNNAKIAVSFVINYEEVSNHQIFMSMSGRRLITLVTGW
jgi:hypothetical protein